MTDPVVAETNQRLFEIFKKRLQPPLKNFGPIAKKFGEWLQNEKAYYLEARKEIVEILVIAETTLRESVGLEEYRSLADAYTQLILCVVPFRERFVEPELRVSVEKLIASVPNPPPAAPAAPQIPPPDPVNATPFAPSTFIAASQQMRPSSSSLASALTPPTSSIVRANTAPAPVKQNTDNPSVPSTRALSTVPGPTNVASASASSSASAPVASGSTSAPGASGLPSAPVAKPKRKKKKKEDFTKLLQADVQLFNEQRGTVAQPTPITPTPAITAVGSGPPSVLPTTSEGVPTTTPQQTNPPTNIHVSASSAVASKSINPVVEETPIGVESTSEKPESVPPEGAHLGDTDAVMGTQAQPEDVEIPDSRPQDALDPSNVNPSNPSVSGAPPEALTSMDDEVNRVLRTLTDPGPSLDPHPTITGVAISPGANSLAINSDEAMPLASSGVELPPDTTSMEGIVETSQTSHSVQQAVETDGLIAQPSLDSPAAFQAIIETMQLPTPPVSDERSPPPEGADSLPPDEDTPPSTRTGIEMATIIARHRGLAAGTIGIKFDIHQNQLDSITKWSDRSKHSDDIEGSLCITLLCFLAADIRARLETSTSKDLRTILPDLECSWPKTGGLSLNALWNGQRIDLPMSPPFAMPLNGLVDVSPFLVLGQNTFRITQTRDMSNYWLILCAHHPTPAQINAVARRRRKERDWTGWLEKISRPLQLPFKLPIEV
ncbi:hypothetical protein B0H17DRAFT_1044202 [Mycena rosella]|uniref:Uncharacterized protein n=1 Tax=Mycena rosella TaxID=1033263 RepID=A0AAD7DYQ5_MYCRO|nr:hypothetical protein B0H17DRAFT_1044202 [Mycena rosella]